MNRNDVLNYQKKYAKASAEEIISWAVNYFGLDKVSLASSLGLEDQVLTHMIMSNNPRCSIFTLDTGRILQETYDTIEYTMARYDFRYEFLFPNFLAVQDMEKEYGPNLFYRSIENRKKCCHVRKVEPLKRKLSTISAWICGLRREQAITRSDVNKIEWDESNGLIKLNPIADWSEAQVWDYIKKNKIPFNPLQSKGYSSIGCAPCTRAVEDGQDIRSGRWWWESPEHKECGLHSKKINEE